MNISPDIRIKLNKLIIGVRFADINYICDRIEELTTDDDSLTTHEETKIPTVTIATIDKLPKEWYLNKDGQSWCFDNGTYVDLKRFPELAPFCKIEESVDFTKLLNHIITFNYNTLEKVGLVDNLGLNRINLADHPNSYEIKHITNVQILKRPTE